MRNLFGRWAVQVVAVLATWPPIGFQPNPDPEAETSSSGASLGHAAVTKRELRSQVSARMAGSRSRIYGVHSENYVASRRNTTGLRVPLIWSLGEGGGMGGKSCMFNNI